MPVRRIPIGTRAVTGQHARSGARYESSLERDFFELMMADPQVLSIEEQPVRISYLNDQKKRRHYTPDALVKFKSDPVSGKCRPPLLCEVKYRDEYRSKFVELRGRLRAARKYAKQMGWKFRVITDREIRTVRFSNLHFLAGFIDREPDMKHVDALLQAFPGANGTTPAVLLHSIDKDAWKQAEALPSLWWLVANERLRINHAVPISMLSELTLAT